jgi:hypothetical protein
MSSTGGDACPFDQPCRLLAVTGLTQKLKVGHIVKASQAQRDDVIELRGNSSCWIYCWRSMRRAVSALLTKTSTAPAADCAFATSSDEATFASRSAPAEVFAMDDLDASYRAIAY